MNPEDFEDDEENVTDGETIQRDDDPDIKEQMDDGVDVWARRSLYM